ncbi:SDR family oxidoreductase [Halomonas sp. SBBP1]|uniref:SDR family oxidoreductase n=1 Tax=Halomonas sp. SBBP1 TaxID=2599306 RepID=UPI001CF2BFCC|nr:SDR family oxidoreductase [Halomonas sp. SBBP1]MCA8864617.1 SDR family oxidoreductase [Halomonas sp. SBBP1]
MKIFIVGITGNVGFRLARTLKERGDEVDGLYRQPDQAGMLASIGVTGTVGDLVNIDPQRLAEAMRGSDAIVFTAGAGGAGSEMTEAIDGNGVTKSIAAAKLAGIKRFLLVSVFPEAWRERHMDEGFEHYIMVKKRADIELSQSGLDWIILRPSALKDNAGAGTINLGVAQIHTEVSRDDVAVTLATLLHTPAVSRKILELTEGNVPIPEAVNAMTSI